MARLTKKQRAISEKLVAGKQYAIDEAVALLESLPRAKFAESIDVAINLGVDARKSDQQVRGATTLPHGAGKTVRVAVFTQGANADAAKAAGADVVGMDDLAEQVKAGNMDFDVVVASPDAMRVVGQLGQILGPRGLMPNPKTGTVTPDVATAVRNAKAGQVRYRTDKNGIVHGAIGKLGFQTGPRSGVLLHRNLVFEIDELGVHRLNIATQRFKFAHHRLAVIQRLGQVRFHARLVIVQHGKLVLQELHDRIGLGDQVRCDRSGRAGAVLHHHRLAELLADLGGEQARRDVGAAARREAHE